jgi:hypothetical protein
MLLKLSRRIGSRGSSWSEPIMNLVMAVRAERNGIVNLIGAAFLARHYVMDLHPVQGPTNAAMPTSLHEQFLNLPLLKGHSSPFHPDFLSSQSRGRSAEAPPAQPAAFADVDSPVIQGFFSGNRFSKAVNLSQSIRLF